MIEINMYLGRSNVLLLLYFIWPVREITETSQNSKTDLATDTVTEMFRPSNSIKEMLHPQTFRYLMSIQPFLMLFTFLNR